MRLSEFWIRSLNDVFSSCRMETCFDQNDLACHHKSIYDNTVRFFLCHDINLINFNVQSRLQYQYHIWYLSHNISITFGTWVTRDFELKKVFWSEPKEMESILQKQPPMVLCKKNCSWKYFSQLSHQNTCVGVFFLEKKDSSTDVLLWILQNF